MTSSSSHPAAKKRTLVLVVLDVLAGVVFIIFGLAIGAGVLLTAASFGSITSECGAGPYEGLSCNTTVLSIVVYGLIVVAIVAFFLGLGLFIVNMVRKRYGFYWPLAGILVTVGLYYLGVWILGFVAR